MCKSGGSALRSKDIDEEFARSEIEAGHPSYRDPRRATTREPSVIARQRRKREERTRRDEENRARYHAQQQAFWANKGTPREVQEKLGIGGKERLRPSLSVQATTTKTQERAYRAQKKREREERRAQKHAYKLERAYGQPDLTKRQRDRRGLSEQGTTTRAQHAEWLRTQRAEREAELAKPMLLGIGGKERLRPSLSVDATRTKTKEIAFMEHERRKYSKRKEMERAAGPEPLGQELSGVHRDRHELSEEGTTIEAEQAAGKRQRIKKSETALLDEIAELNIPFSQPGTVVPDRRKLDKRPRKKMPSATLLMAAAIPPTHVPGQ